MHKQQSFYTSNALKNVMTGLLRGVKASFFPN